ncbi:MAG: hypothetical protein QNJ42_14990 [Crocosphaera sp.]|nr:hypothetical protein [Crocosphaera sp.]
MSEEQKNTKKLLLSLKERIMLLVPILVLFTGLAMILIYPLGIVGNLGNFSFSVYFKYASVSVLLAGTSLLIGGCIGFLFGIPRTLQNQDNTNQSKDKQLPYRVNTNLEQISDWLTKILVGVGLTQLSSLSSNLEKLLDFFNTKLGNDQNKNVGIYAIIVILYFLVFGFLLGYISTRLFLTTEFVRADNAALDQIEKRLTHTAEKIEKTLTEREKQLEKDAKALSFVDLYLESMDRKKVGIEEVKEVIKQASSSIKKQIFSQAQKIRKDNWNKEEDKDTLNKVIPILKFLLEDKSEDTSKKIPEYKLWAELGYTLKDQEQPDWKKAENCLKKAIELRGDWQQEGNRMYEFNRAYCLIKLDKDFHQKKPNSDKKEREEIINHIAIAVSRKKLRRIVAENEVFQQWIKINKVSQLELDKESDDQVKQEIPNIISSQ